MASFHQCLIIPSIAVKIIQNVSKFLERTDLVCATDDIHEYLLSYFHTTTIFSGIWDVSESFSRFSRENCGVYFKDFELSGFGILKFLAFF
jgi:hypothetical protein